MAPLSLDHLDVQPVDNPGAVQKLKISEDGKWLDRIPAGPLAYAPDPHLWIIPGLIDSHVHGGMGITFGEHPDRLAEDLSAYSEWVTGNGVTGFLCSIAAATPAELLNLVRAYVAILPRRLPGAACLGLHLEGPFLSETRRGAFQPAWLREPSLAELHDLIRAGQGWIRQITLAPELPGALEAAREIQAAGMVACMGHTDGDYETISAALRSGFDHVTHMYNAMSTFHHMTPGAVGAVLTSSEITAELIADGVHVHPGAMRLLLRCLGPERIILVTDAMAGAGMPDGTYELVGAPVIVKNGQARRLEDGRLAGSVSTLNRCVANTIKLAGADFHQAVQMATVNPARRLRLGSQIGSLQMGQNATFALVDESMNIYQTVIQGRIVFENFAARPDPLERSS